MQFKVLARPKKGPKAIQESPSCVVCGRLANCCHYNVHCCDACAAFFKRIVCSPIPTYCRCHRRRTKRLANSQHSCKYCRLLRCVRAGLQAPGYFPLGFSSHCPPNSGGTFWEMVYRRNYLYVERLRTMTAIGIDPGFDRPPTHDCMVASYRNEMGLLRQFLHQSTEIMRCMRADVTPDTLSQHFFVIWVTLENLLTTMRRSAHMANRLVFIDGSSLNVTLDWLLKACCTNVSITDPVLVASLCVDKFRDILSFAEHMRRSDLDDAEICALCLLAFAHYEADLFANPPIQKQFVDSVWRDLHKHYRNTYADVAVRMGNIAALIGEFHNVQHYRHEVCVVVELASKSHADDARKRDCRQSHRLILMND